MLIRFPTPPPPRWIIPTQQRHLHPCNRIITKAAGGIQRNCSSIIPGLVFFLSFSAYIYPSRTGNNSLCHRRFIPIHWALSSWIGGPSAFDAGQESSSSRMLRVHCATTWMLRPGFFFYIPVMSFGRFRINKEADADGKCAALSALLLLERSDGQVFFFFSLLPNSSSLKSRIFI